METRSNRLQVFLVIGAIAMALFAFAFWLLAGKNPDGLEYLIRFEDSVMGVKTGSPVTYSGVSAGLVTAVRFDGEDPSTVLVTVRLNPEIPILEGVEAQISRSLLGGDATIIIDGGRPGASRIAATDGESLPIIPEKKSGLLGSGGDPVALIEKISRSVDNISADLDEKGQQRTRERLAELNAKTAVWPTKAARLADVIAGAGDGMRGVSNSIAGVGERAARVRANLEARRDGSLGIDDKLRSAQRAAEEFRGDVDSLRPAVRALEGRSREITESVRSARSTTQHLGDQVERIDREGLQLFGAPKLSDYNSANQSPPPSR
ncbi:MlaD family protein [Sphingomonas aestuarii]